MNIFKVKVIVEESPEVNRVLALPENLSYEQFHQILIKIFGIGQRMPASFFESDESWKKYKEIAVDQFKILDGSIDGRDELLAFTDEKEVKQMIYFNDATPHVSYLVFFEKKLKAEEGVKYPQLLKTEGNLRDSFGDGIFDEELGFEWDDFDKDGFTEDNL